jgi:hypothetical protein
MRFHLENRAQRSERLVFLPSQQEGLEGKQGSPLIISNSLTQQIAPPQAKRRESHPLSEAKRPLNTKQGRGFQKLPALSLRSYHQHIFWVNYTVGTVPGLVAHTCFLVVMEARAFCKQGKCLFYLPQSYPSL